MKLSVLCITRNSADTIEDMLISIKGLFDELLVSDQQSTDKTITLLKRYDATIFSTKIVNIGKRFGFLLNKAIGDWILILVPDEKLSLELKQEITEILSKKSFPYHFGYQIPFQNYVFNKPVFFGGEQYSRIRLFRRKHVKISEDPIHEEITILGQVGYLDGKIYHHSYRSPSQLFLKFSIYARISSELKFKKYEHITVKKLFLYGPHMFWARFIKEKGYKDGFAGFILAMAFAYMETLTYWLLLLKKLHLV